MGRGFEGLIPRQKHHFRCWIALCCGMKCPTYLANKKTIFAFSCLEWSAASIKFQNISVERIRLILLQYKQCEDNLQYLDKVLELPWTSWRRVVNNVMTISLVSSHWHGLRLVQRCRQSGDKRDTDQNQNAVFVRRKEEKPFKSN